MIKNLFFIALLFNSFLAFSQNKENLNQLVKDSIQCYNLNLKIEEENDHFVWIRYNNDLKKISAYNSVVKNTIFKKTFLKYYAIALLNEGAYYNYTDRFEQAIISYKKSFKVAKQINFYEQCASNLQNIGTAFDFLGNSDSSFVYFTNALKYAYKSKNKSNIAYVLTDLGYVNNTRGNTATAIENNLQALKIFEELNDIEGIERTYLALGRIFDNQKEFEKAILYYKKGLQIAIKNKLENRECIYLNSLANVHFQINKNKESELFAKKALLVATKNNFEIIKAISLMHLGDIYFDENKMDLAENFYKQSAAVFKNLNGDNNYCRVLIDLGKIKIRKKEYQSALMLANQSYELAKKSNYPSEKKAAAELLSETHFLTKNFKQAYDYQTIAKTIGDSIFYDENKNIALKSEFKYETEKKEAEINQLSQAKKITELENKRQKTTLLLLLIGIISALVTSYLLFKRYKTNKQNELLKSEIEKSQAEKKATESELKALKSQMNPHFIFNALNSIQEQFMFGDKVVANEQMGNFTSLTRQILSVSGKKKISLATEIDILTKYLELEKMRFENDFEYLTEIDDAIDDEYTQLPPMLLQPFVENSIKHGLLHKDGLKKVTITFDLNEDENQLICTIEDNGIGRKKSEEIKVNNKHNSFSTESVAQRLQLLNNETLDDSLVYEDLTDENGIGIGTKVVLKIQLS